MFKVPISNGELVDKITILNIKKKKINDLDKLKYVDTELNELNKLLNELHSKFDIKDLMIQLETVNNKLWIIEDDLRIKEKNNEFDDNFIQLARSVYKTNDHRALLKKKINELTGSKLSEVKSYK